jgi:hypothetical protein
MSELLNDFFLLQSPPNLRFFDRQWRENSEECLV